ncbi:cell division protein FtsL [Beggiatoa alba B18LD]|uniref:Cell division protein FtsL n=1 Tax=Beggiatoa alba B18LD TaxID=395493 RepID=I3CH59_9GAMM|nr:cell division protein FtsL [Beggiatoa alba]EIJ42952.1 cell division protein FtsL [Beggiatoa alba B18LD]
MSTWFTKFLFVLLFTWLFAASIQLIVVRHQTRMLFAELQRLEKQRDELNIHWGRLQIEQTTYEQHERIESLAREKLRMFAPMGKDIVIVTSSPVVNP